MTFHRCEAKVNDTIAVSKDANLKDRTSYFASIVSGNHRLLIHAGKDLSIANVVLSVSGSEAVPIQYPTQLPIPLEVNGLSTLYTPLRTQSKQVSPSPMLVASLAP